ncbi:MAG: SDR family oxidoreductase [Anaerolineae bacterium]|nr:SDR family oxidoreductase [Anaerolineae bacterium]
MRAFVTGSTGFLGSNLVQLLLAQGHQVKALARSVEKARKLLTDPRVEIVIGDMENIDGFKAHLAGCDVLFHTAAYFREYFEIGQDHWSKLEQINIKGTIQLLETAEQMGVKKTIYVSSSGVIGRASDQRPADETTPPDSLALETNIYFKSKVIAEQEVAKFVRSHQMPVILILPTAILGPQDAAPTALGQAIVDVINGKFPVIPPGGFEFVDARDVAQGMINAVEHGQNGERYILSAGYHSMAELVQAIGQTAGVKVPRMVMPYPLMRLMAQFAEMGARMRGKSPDITVNAVDTMAHQYPVTAQKAQRELRVHFRPFHETVRDEVHWYTQQGYVKAKSTPTFAGV